MVFRSKLTIWCIFIDKYLGGGWSAVAFGEPRIVRTANACKGIPSYEKVL